MLETAKRVFSFYLVAQLAINMIVIAVLFAGSLAGAALYGKMMATLGMVSPFIFLTELGLNISTAGFINLVVSIGWAFSAIGRGTFRKTVDEAFTITAQTIRKAR